MLRILHISLTLLLLSAPAALLQASERSEPVMLEVIDTYADVHSGPGRGYPVFHVIEQGEKIELLARRPDWYEIRSEKGKIGWVNASQISRTIQATGEPADLPSVGYGDYIKNTWVVGFSLGQFAKGDLEGFELFSANVGYRFLHWLGAGAELGRGFGSDRSLDFQALNLYVEPFSDWKFSPYLGLGMGKISVSSAPQLGVFELDSNFQSYALGTSFYLGRNFVVKGEYRWYSLDEESDNEKLESWKLGFNTFF